MEFIRKIAKKHIVILKIVNGLFKKPKGFSIIPFGFFRNPKGFSINPLGFSINPFGFFNKPKGFSINPFGFLNNPFTILRLTKPCLQLKEAI